MTTDNHSQRNPLEFDFQGIIHSLIDQRLVQLVCAVSRFGSAVAEVYGHR